MKNRSDAGFEVIFSYIKGKYSDDSRCEDAIFCGKRFTAVIDGVTSKGKYLYQGTKTSGRYAAEVLAQELGTIDCEETADLTATEILTRLDKALKAAMQREFPNSDTRTEDRLRASVIILDHKKREVINYGDCQCRIGDAVYSHTKQIDVELSEKRSEILQQAMNEGASIEQLRSNDIGRAAILPDLQKQFEYENQEGPYGYPVLNGQGINEQMITIHPLGEQETVILCSDGYPFICKTWEESEQKLVELLAADPLLMDQYKSTKGKQPGADSYDDRSWVVARGASRGRSF